MRPLTPGEMNIPSGFDGLVNVARTDGNPIFGARITQWTDHGIVIVYDTEMVPDSSIDRVLQPARVRRFIPFAALSSVTAIISQGPEA